MYNRILALFSSAAYQEPTSNDETNINLAAHLTNTSLQTDKGEQYVRLLDELVGTSILSESNDVQKTFTEDDLKDICAQVASLLGESFKAALGMSVHFQVCRTGACDHTSMLIIGFRHSRF
jgi:tubulin---tyrosine ligase